MLVFRIPGRIIGSSFHKTLHLYNRNMGANCTCINRDLAEPKPSFDRESLERFVAETSLLETVSDSYLESSSHPEVQEAAKECGLEPSTLE